MEMLILHTGCFRAFQGYPNIISCEVTYNYVSNWLAPVLVENDWLWSETGRMSDEEFCLALAMIGNAINFCYGVFKDCKLK